MQDFLSGWYLWTKAFHVIAVITWMAALFYLPRLFVYHVEQVVPASPTDAMFQTMERRLQRGIMTPAAIASWLFGLGLVMTPGIVDWTAVWPWTKAASVLAMTGFHFYLTRCRIALLQGRNRLSGRQYRMLNELPTLLLLVIVISVIVKF